MNKRNRLFKSFTAFLMSFCMVMPNNVITFADEESPAETADPVTETAEQAEETDVQQEQITEEEPEEEASGEAETTEAEIPEPVLRKYEYKDSNVIVKAVLQDAAAVPCFASNIMPTSCLC